MGVKDEFDRTTALLLEEMPQVIGQTSTPTPATDALTSVEEAVLGTIGFGGEEMRGSVLLVGHPKIWRSIGPAGFAADTLSSAQMCDMVGELCNMLAGRLKKRLLRLGVEIVCGIPTATYGHLALPALPRTSALHVTTFEVMTAAGPLYLRADVLFSDDFAFPTETATAIEPAETDLFF